MSSLLLGMVCLICADSLKGLGECYLLEVLFDSNL